MISMYDVLKASKGIHVDDTFAELWGRKLSNAYTVATYTGTLPATLQTVAGYLESYKIYGDSVQDGTPTPENPIMPSGCGEMETTGAHAGQYKLPILSNSTLTNIYLGEVETTRRIKKLVLTGEENYGKNSGQRTNYLYHAQRANILPGSMGKTPVLCNELPVKDSPPVVDIGINTRNDYSVAYLNFGADVMNAQPSGNTIAGLKEYLAAQYAAGTPVTVWYVLSEPETGIVNEPLMKIGGYADTIDSTQTTAQIPTAAGTTIIDYNGTPKPDKVELTYKKTERTVIL